MKKYTDREVIELLEQIRNNIYKWCDSQLAIKGFIIANTNSDYTEVIIRKRDNAIMGLNLLVGNDLSFPFANDFDIWIQTQEFKIVAPEYNLSVYIDSSVCKQIDKVYHTYFYN